jgi:hypothetical protein
MSYSNLLDSSCNVTRATNTDDGSGGQSVAWGVIYLRKPMRFESTMGKQMGEVYGKATVIPQYFVYAEGGLAIKEGDRLVGVKGHVTGRTFGVLFINDWSEQGKYLKLAVTEIARGE